MELEVSILVLILLIVFLLFGSGKFSFDEKRRQEKLKKQQQGPGDGGGKVPPQMDEVIKKVKNVKLPGGPLLILILLALFFGSSTFFSIGVDEVGVVQRFGKYVRTTQPGLNFKLPSGIEKVTKVKVRRVFKEEFGFRSVREPGKERFSSGSENMNRI